MGDHSTYQTSIKNIYISRRQASLVAQQQIIQPVQEMWVRFLGQEDSLEEEVATHSSILASEIPWTEEPRSYNPC